MTIHFCNKGEIELDTIRTMGVSVKETDNPIGYFGTGLKYAIATLLRTGHTVSLRTGENRFTYHFTAKPKMIRNKEFQVVYMNDEQMGFTTDLGKNWEVWQAYRELYANCMDELGTVGGVVTDDADTIFSVDGPDIAEIHAERGKIFLQSEPWLIGNGIEVHRGKSNFLYYRGVRVHTLQIPTRLTYNFTAAMSLTEDRTLVSEHDAQYKLSTRLPSIPDKELALKILDPKNNDTFYESQISFGNAYDPSEEFIDGADVYFNNANLNSGVRELVKRKRNKETEFELFQLDASQLQIAQEACVLLKKLNCLVQPNDFLYAETLGPGVYALQKDDKMFIAREVISLGSTHLARAMYEEWIHLTMGYNDESRAMQNWLFTKIFELVTR